MLDHRRYRHHIPHIVLVGYVPPAFLALVPPASVLTLSLHAVGLDLKDGRCRLLKYNHHFLLEVKQRYRPCLSGL